MGFWVILKLKGGSLDWGRDKVRDEMSGGDDEEGK